MLKRVSPGLYVRTDSPPKVKITQKFADVVNSSSGSATLSEIVNEALRIQRPDGKYTSK